MATENSDTNALAAVESFFSEGNRESEAVEEVGHDLNSSVVNEVTQQNDELVEEGLVSETGLDGVPEKPAANKPAEKVEATPAETDKAPEIDPNLRLLANEAGLTNERIDRLLKADPELAQELINEAAQSYVDSSRQLLNAPAQAQAAASQAQPAQSASLPTLPPALTDEALVKFAEANGEEVAEVVRTLRDTLFAPLQEIQQRLEDRERQEIAAEAYKALDAVAEKHSDVYGAKGASENAITVGQLNKRRELFALADQLSAGARAQGRKLSTTDAITRANAILTRDAVAKTTRQQITSQVQKRAKTSLAKPTARTAPAANGGKTDSAALQAAATKWAEIEAGN